MCPFFETTSLVSCGCLANESAVLYCGANFEVVKGGIAKCRACYGDMGYVMSKGKTQSLPELCH